MAPQWQAIRVPGEQCMQQRLCRVSYRFIACGLVLMGGRLAWAQAGLPQGLSSSTDTALVDAPGYDSSADDTGSQPTPPKRKYIYVHENNFTVGGSAQLTATRTANQYGSQFLSGTTPTIGLLVGLHQQFRPLAGYHVNFGYTRLTQNYERNDGNVNPSTGVTSGTFTRGSIPADMYEVSGTYVVKRPQLGRQYQPFAEAGGGVVIFAPTTPPYKGFASYRASFVFGAGVEYRMGYHLGLRAEYRGLLYKYPDFGSVISTVPTSKFFTVTSEPAISLIYRFGGHGGLQ